MHMTPLSQSARSAPRSRAVTWLRRATLLGCIAVSLALVGDQAAARTWVQAGPGPVPGVDAQSRSTGLGLALLAVNTAHRSVGSWSDGSFEAVSLLALGLGLLGAGQVLGRTRHPGPGASRRAAGSPNAPGAVLRPHLPRLRSIGGRSGR